MERDRKGRLPWAIVLLIIAFSCAIAYSGALIANRTRNASSFGNYRTVQLENVQAIQAVKDGFVYYDGSVVSKVGADGERKWNYMVGPGVSVECTDEGAATWIGKKLTLISNASGVADFSGNMDGDVLSARMGSQYAAIVIGPEHNSTIVLMENGGRKVDSITLSNQTVIDYGFFYNDSLFWVMTLDTNGTTPSCTVNTYRPGRRMVGSITDAEQLLYHVVFQSNQIACSGDTFMKVFDYNGTEIKEKRQLIYGWTLVDADESSDNPLMALTLNGEYDSSSMIRDVRLIRGSADEIIRMPYGCASLVTLGDRVYGFSPEGYVMIARLGKQKADAYQLPVAFDKVYGVASGNVAILGAGNLVYLVSLE